MTTRWCATAALVAVAVASCSSGGDDRTSAPSSAAATSTTLAPDCEPARVAPAPQRTYTFRFGGNNRTYTMSVPDSYDGRAEFPLVFNFAGFAGTKESHEAFTEMGAKGSARGFFVVTPDALGSPREWNMFALPNRPDDFAFVHALVTDIERRLCIDSDRVFAAGHSNGSAFAAFLVCREPHVFAAVAMVSATTPANCPDGVAPAVLAIAGTADISVPYEGGTVGGSTIPVPAARATISAYAEHYRCASSPRETSPSAGVTEIRYSGCVDDTEVTLDTVAGGTHTWPGGPAAAAEANNSEAGKSFDATGHILDFFARHHRPS